MTTEYITDNAAFSDRLNCNNNSNEMLGLEFSMAATGSYGAASPPTR